MPIGRPSEWPILFDVAVQILRHAEATIGYPPIWSFGGGTALMLQIEHRESHDIDLFLDDPQLLPFLNPESQGIDVALRPDSYSTNGTTVLKLAFQHIGEIDFICCAHVLDPSSQPSDVRGQTVRLETPAEIVAKKVYYRGWNFQPRDIFDLAAVADRCGTDYTIDALAGAGRAACEKALSVVERATPAFVQSINSQLLVREATRPLIGKAKEITHDFLQRAIERAG